MATKTDQSKPVTVVYTKKGSKVEVKPKNKKLYDERAEAIVSRALSIIKDIDEEEGSQILEFAQDLMSKALTDFQKLVHRLGVWTSRHENKIEQAYLAKDHGGLVFLVVQKEKKDDQDLLDTLIDLDIHVARDTSLKYFDLEVMCVPKVSNYSLLSFVKSGFLFNFIHGK